LTDIDQPFHTDAPLSLVAKKLDAILLLYYYFPL